MYLIDLTNAEKIQNIYLFSQIDASLIKIYTSMRIAFMDSYVKYTIFLH
jgi:hypothetical protein